ncbi:MAG: glutamyl-tRNA reductase, partial [Candidatus Omnitrophica bacterium]|nr:glutamyl-tRNA reductase [Candidatus Omnitrophota bacterium]
LFRVASGLDSMVIGEPQIMGQIRKAYDEACANGAIGPCLHRAIQDSLQVGKKVRSITGISRGVTSISGVVVELVKKEPGLATKKVLVIGAGKMGALTVEKLADLPIGGITVINRDTTRAAELQKLCNVRVSDIHKLGEEVRAADIVIAATASTQYLLDRAMVEQALGHGRKELVLVDLGVPRNIDETARVLDGVRLFNIDDLTPIVKETLRNRAIEAEKAEAIIESKLEMMGVKPLVTVSKEINANDRIWNKEECLSAKAA